ncbi:hypothetical protein PV328_011228 [Microctonus aethiopoides]|uniref:TIR domain-containing protein n=1 Tax=Microctonus aethiopoides TaxID=144406 RepID=A0AA39EY66_9HYME|nr:hypothetical protein PV328_011228 [Microctonus aethiopoides]
MSCLFYSQSWTRKSGNLSIENCSGERGKSCTILLAVQQHYSSDSYFSRELYEKSGVRIWEVEVGKKSRGIPDYHKPIVSVLEIGDDDAGNDDGLLQAQYPDIVERRKYPYEHLSKLSTVRF